MRSGKQTVVANGIETSPVFSSKLERRAYQIFRHTLTPPNNRDEITLGLAAKEVKNCLYIEGYTPYVVFEKLLGGVWPGDEGLGEVDTQSAASICLFLVGIRPDLVESGRVPHTLDGYQNILASIYRDFGRTWPRYNALSADCSNLVRGSRIVAQAYLRPDTSVISLR